MAHCTELQRAGYDATDVAISGSIAKLSGRKNKLRSARWTMSWVVVARNFLFVYHASRVRARAVPAGRGGGAVLPTALTQRVVLPG